MNQILFTTRYIKKDLIVDNEVSTVSFYISIIPRLYSKGWYQVLLYIYHTQALQ